MPPYIKKGKVYWTYHHERYKFMECFVGEEKKKNIEEEEQFYTVQQNLSTVLPKQITLTKLSLTSQQYC